MRISRIKQVSLTRAAIIALAGTALITAASGVFGSAAEGANTGAEPSVKIYAGPEIVVTATRIEWPLDKTASFMTVISRSDIERRHAESVGELLRSVVGLNVVQSGSAGKASSVFVRGSNSNHILVLLDGVPLNDPTTGAFDFSELPTAGIERIEIVRGPHGILYGSNAIGGVINIITRTTAEGAKRSVSVAAGTYRSAGGAVSIAGGEHSYRYSYSLSGATTDGLAENDFHKNLTFSGSASSRMTATSNVSLSLRYREAESGLRGPSYAPDPNARQDGGHFIVSTSYRQIVSGLWSFSVRTSFLSREITWKDPVDALDSGPFAGDGFSEINSRAKCVAWQNDLHFTDHLWLISGAEWKEEQTTNSGYSPFGTTSFDDRALTASAFANGILDFAGFPTTSAGVRLDDHSEFGAVATYKLSIAYSMPGTRGALKGSIGTGFRAPSLNELYYPGYGNPSLEPERTFGYDVGVTWDFAGSRVSVELGYFGNEYRNMISSNPVTWLADNIGEARSDGLELQSELRPFASLALRAFYTFTRTEDCATEKQLLRRPRHSGGAELSYRYGPFDAYFAASRVGARLDNDFGGPYGECFSPAYTRLDAGLTYRSSDAGEVFCTLNNAADERYEEVAGYPAPGARFTIGTSMDF